MMQDADGNERLVNAKDGVNGRVIESSDGSWVPIRDWVDPQGEMGPITTNWKTNKSQAAPMSFKTDKLAEIENDRIDEDVKSGKMSEEEGKVARDKIISTTTNPITGRKYDTKIPNAKSIGKTGLVTFGELSESEKKLNGQTAATIRGFAKVEAILDHPAAAANVKKWSSWFATNMANKQIEPSLMKSYIRANVGNDVQAAFYLGLLEIGQARLRKETGAAYTMKELNDTMELGPTASDNTRSFELVKLAGIKGDIYSAASSLGSSSGQYHVGVLEGNFRPTDAHAEMMTNLYDVLEDPENYPEGDIANLDGSSNSTTTVTNEDYENAYMNQE